MQIIILIVKGLLSSTYIINCWRLVLMIVIISELFGQFFGGSGL